MVNKIIVFGLATHKIYVILTTAHSQLYVGHPDTSSHFLQFGNNLEIKIAFLH